MPQSAHEYSSQDVGPLSKRSATIRRSLRSVILCYAICREAVHAFAPSVSSNRMSLRSQLNAATTFPMDIPTFEVNSPPAAASPSQPKVGVLLLNLGGPETGDDVEGLLCLARVVFRLGRVFLCSSVRGLTLTLDYIFRILVQSLC